MNNLSAPPSGNALPQGEKRKRSSEPPPPPPPPQNAKAAATRARIVEILANTANGCLSELGYFPGMPAKLKELEIQNNIWKEENVKLFQDNRHLLAMVKEKTRMLELAGLPEPSRVQRMVDLEHEVQLLRREVEEWRNNAQYKKLLDDYRKLTESYRLAYTEVGRLTTELHTLAGRIQQRPGVSQQPQHPLQRSQSVSHMPRSAMMIPQTQPVMLPQSVQPTISPTTIIQPHPQIPNISHQGQRIDALTQPQVFQNRQLAGSNPASRRSSLNIANPPIQVPPQGPNSPAQAAPPPQKVFQPPHFGPQPQATTAPVPPNPTEARRVSSSSAPVTISIPPSSNPYPVPQIPRARDSVVSGGNPYPVVPPAQPVPVQALPVPRDSKPINTPTVRTGSAPLPSNTNVINQPPAVNLPPPPPSASSILTHTSVFPPQPAPIPAPSPSQQEQPPVQTISPRETYINPPSQPQVQPSNTIPPAQQSQFVTSPSPAAPSQNIGQTEMASAVSNLSMNTPGVSEPVSTPFHQSSATPSTAASYQQQAPPQHTQVASPPVDHVPQQNVPAGVAESASQTSFVGHHDAMEVDAEGEEESEEEVELGPDGLRLVSDCLDQLFGELRVGQVVCPLCHARYEKGVVDEPPEPFINPTDDQLEAHCIEEHKGPWDQLREP